MCVCVCVCVTVKRRIQKNDQNEIPGEKGKKIKGKKI